MTMHGMRSRLRQNWDFLTVLLLIVASLPAEIFSSRALVMVSEPNPLDDSWILDASFKAAHGIWLGRDVAFTYGPLFQWLSSAPSRVLGMSMGSIYATWNLLPLCCTFVLGWLTLRLLLPEQPRWKRFLLLLLLSVFWTPPDLRISLAIFLFVAFLRGWYAVRLQQFRPGILEFCAAVLCIAAFLYSADTGVYAIAGLLISLAAVAWEGRREPHAGRRFGFSLLAFAVAFVVLLLAINILMSDPPSFRFWKSSLAIVSAYRWIEPAAMTKADKLHLLATVAAGAAIFLLRHAVLEEDSNNVTGRPGFLVGAFLFALLAMQSGLVRSDEGHIAIASFAMVFFVGAILFSFSWRAASAVAISAAVLCSIFFAQPASVFTPSSLRYRFARLGHPLTECPSDFLEFDRACFPEELTGSLSAASDYLRQHTGVNDPIVVFPYQTMFGIASGRSVAAGVVQSFLAAPPYLSRLDIAGLDRAAAPAGLYLPDLDPAQDTNWVASLPIDGVSNFTRNSEVWLWIFRHYRSQPLNAPGITGLQWDESRATRIATQSQPTGITRQNFLIRGRSSTLDLGEPAWPGDGADFLRLRLTVRYSFWWKVRKPERLQLEITRADRSRDLRSFLVEPYVESEVWFYPWNELDLAGYFDSDQSRWHTGSRPPITNLRLWVTPLDWVSVQPDSVLVESVEAVKFSMAR